MWIVKYCEWFANEPSGYALTSWVQRCEDEQSAIQHLNDTIRHDWTSFVYDEEYIESPLADLRGYGEDEGERAEVFYSTDGKKAWHDMGDHMYRGEVQFI